MSAAPQHTHRHKTLANAEGLTTFHSPRPLVCTCRRSGENVLPHSPSPSLSLSLSPLLLAMRVRVSQHSFFALFHHLVSLLVS